MEAVIGISIIVTIAILIGISKRRKTTPLMSDQQQDIVEQVAIIQPIIRDNLDKK